MLFLSPAIAYIVAIHICMYYLLHYKYIVAGSAGQDRHSDSTRASSNSAASTDVLHVPNANNQNRSSVAPLHGDSSVSPQVSVFE